MSSSPALILVTTTLDTEIGARDMAEQILAHQLAACIHIDTVHALYRWADDIHQGTEYRLTIKTQASCYPALAQLIESLHTYEIPEILCFPIVAQQDYQDWVVAETTHQDDSCTKHAHDCSCASHHHNDQ